MTTTADLSTADVTTAPLISAEQRDTLLGGIIQATAGAVAQNPGAAQVVFTSTGTSAGTVATDVRSRQHAWVVDEPASLGGDDSATNPVEYALGAFIGCQVVTYRFWAARLGIRLDDVRIAAEGDLDVRGFFGLADDVRAGFTDIRLAVTLVGPESAERYAELQAAVDAHCPVLDLFANPTPVQTTLAVAGS
jgi:uncharacterized OsmC-like protein